MSLTRINHNISSLNAQRNLGLNTDRLNTAIERLSSGLRINRAADDPSGLVMSELLRKQISGLGVAIDNASQGVNLIKTAEAALNEVSANLRQMRDLALKAASTSNNDDDARAALNEQFQAAISAINQVASNTAYGGLKLLDGSAGINGTVLDSTNIAGAQFVQGNNAVAGYVDINITTAATKANVSGDTTTWTATTDVLGATGSMTLNGKTISYAATDTVADLLADIDTSGAGVTATFQGGNHIHLDQQGYGSTNGIVLVDPDALINSTTAVAWGVDAAATITWSDATTTAFDQGTGLTLKDAENNQIALTTAGNGTGVDPQDGIYITMGSLSFQTGNEVGQTSSTTISSVTAAALGISTLDISTVSGANAAISALDTAVTQVSTTRANLGAFQAGLLETTIRSLSIAHENLTASESSIRDADFGEEVANFTTSQILVQSATSFLTQANALPQNVLALIQGR